MTNDDPLERRPWTVLIVDDEPDVRRYLENVLQRSIPGIQTITAETGKLGLDELAHREVDLILSDHRMPTMTGTEFLTIAAKMRPDVPRVLLTGFADVDVATAAVNGGRVSAFFQKPARVDVLVAEIVRLLKIHQETEHRKLAFARSAELARKKSAPYSGPLGGEDP